MSYADDRSGLVYGALTRELQALGVRDTFGVMSQDTVNFIASSAAHGGIAFHSSRHESVAVMMADGYSWATGGIGVAILGRGPGLANGTNAARTAVNAQSRVLLIAGDLPTVPELGPDNKTANSAAFAEAIGAMHFPVRAPEAVASACRAAADSAQRGRLALLTIPDDILNGPVAKTELSTDRPPADEPDAPSGSSADEFAEAARLLTTSRRPLIIAGRGAVSAGAGPRLELLADRTGAFLGTTLLAKDLFYRHPYDIGVVGGFVSEAAREILSDIDCVIAFGASLNSRTTHQHTLFQDIPIVQVDSDAAALNAYIPIEVGLVADADVAAARILDLIPEREGDAPLHDAQILEKLGVPLYRGPDQSTDDALDPRVLLERLEEVLPPDKWVVSDGGHFMGFAAVYSHVSDAGRFRLTTDFLSIGQGLGAALGTSLARPDATTVLFIGDGGLLMTLGDLETVARWQSRLIIVVMNNQAYRAEVNHLERAQLPHELALIPDVDFAAIAGALGIQSATLRSLEDLAAAAPLLSGACPVLLDCKIHPEIRAPHWMQIRRRVNAASA
jgi:acetolactate synthase-1/2/3 large subunit